MGIAIRGGVRFGGGSSIRQVISDLYSVNNLSPKLVADFSGSLNSGTEYYRTAGTETTFDSMFSYTGASRKTMTDSDGVLKWAPHNVITYSNAFDNATWQKIHANSNNPSVTANQSDGPDADGGGDADLVTFGTINAINDVSIIRHAAPAPPYYQHTFSVWLKSNGASHDGKRVYVYINDNGGIRTYTACVLSSSWQKVSVTGTHVGGLPYFSIATAGSDYFDGLGSASDSDAEVLMWGAHAYRSDLGMVDNPDRGDSYVPTTTSAVYLPRRNSYRWNGSSYVNKGITLESEAATQRIYKTNDIGGSSVWELPEDVTVTNSQALGPDGNLSLSEVKINDVTSGYKFIYCNTGAVTPGIDQFDPTAVGDFTISCYLRIGTQDYVDFRAYNAAYSWATIVIDCTTSTPSIASENTGSGPLTIVDSGIEVVGGGLFRIWMTANDATTSSFSTVSLGFVSGASPSYNAKTGLETITGTLNDNVYVGFFNLTNGTLSSHSPNNASAAVTRAAETLTIAGADMAYSATAMSFHMQGEVNYADNTTSVDNDGDTGEVIPYRWRTDASNFISAALDTDTGGTGGWVWEQEDAGTNDSVSGTASELSPGVNVAFNIAARHTSSAMNGASAGTAATENSTPSTLDDLSAVAFDAGEKMIGTIALFRQWDVDLGDSGIESASS